MNAMTLGELHHGAGVGYNNLVALTLGTGVGGGVVIDGKVYHGNQNTAGELGHTVVEPDGRYCGWRQSGVSRGLCGCEKHRRTHPSENNNWTQHHFSHCNRCRDNR